MKIRFLFLIFQFFYIRGFSQSAEIRIDSLMHSNYKSGDPGAVIVILKHQKTIFKKGYGLADLQSGKPVTANDNFNIGSLTKQFTAYALLTLFYQGKFSLNDSIGKFFKLPAPIASIPVMRLLSHSSGIPDHYGFMDTFSVKHATDKEVLMALQKVDTLYFSSGTRYRYSNTAYCLLGLLIEKLSGMSYADFLQKNIFRPLEIQHASVFKFNQPITNRVIGYMPAKDGKFIKSDAEESVFFSTEADGGIYMSMNNYQKWCRAVESGKFSHTPMIQKAWQARTPVDEVRGLWYGCGWFIQENNNDTIQRKAIYHTGFNGGFRTVVYMIPSADYCISIFSNRGDIDLEELIIQINKILNISNKYYIKSGPFESYIHSWPIFAPCKETSSFSTLSGKNLNAKGMVLN